MRSSNRRAIRACLFSLIVLTFGVPSARAQGETFTATAALKGSGGATVSTPITMSIRQFTSAGDREEMLAALKTSLSQARAFLGKKKDLREHPDWRAADDDQVTCMLTRPQGGCSRSRRSCRSRCPPLVRHRLNLAPVSMPA